MNDKFRLHGRVLVCSIYTFIYCYFSGMSRNLILFICLMLPSLAFSQGQQQDIDIIKASRLASNAAIARHDVAGIAKYWLSGFVQTIGKGTSLTGKDTITSAWKKLFSTNSKVSYVRKSLTITVGDNGVMAWETGTWTATNSYSKGGNYSAMWRKINGQWKLQAELYVSLEKL
jgi:ketosteroid isomerase-like protein